MKRRNAVWSDTVEEHKELLDGKWGHWSHRKDFKLFEVRNEGGENKCYVLFKNGSEQLLGVWH